MKLRFTTNEHICLGVFAYFESKDSFGLDIYIFKFVIALER